MYNCTRIEVAPRWEGEAGLGVEDRPVWECRLLTAQRAGNS